MMLKHVLIAEDQESASISVRKTLEDLGVTAIDYAYYCDDALLRIRKALAEDKPYDLLITDLHFEEDSQVQQLSGGAALITAARQAQPQLNVLVFSAENKPKVIDLLFTDLSINGYVRKARYDAQELKLAIKMIDQQRQHFPGHLRQQIQQKNAHQFTDFDITIISQLAQGQLQKNLPAYLQARHIKPSGLSSIEKRLNIMKETFGFSKNEQLVAFCKDNGII
ncbi:response regulator [Mucilaginibacter sp.]